MCDKGCGLVFTTELAGQFTFMWQIFLRKSHMRAKILNDKLLIFCFAAITLFFPPCPMCTFPLSSLYKATKAHTHTHRTWGKKSTPLLLCILSVCCSGRGFGWSALIAMGLSLSLVLCSKKKKTKKRSLLIHQTSTCQTLAQENCHKFFFLFVFLLFSSWQITVMSQTVRREQWSAFCLPFSIANWILCNPSEHACTVEVSHHRWTSTTDTIATTGKKKKPKYNQPEFHWHQPPGLKLQLNSLHPHHHPLPLIAFTPTETCRFAPRNGKEWRMTSFSFLKFLLWKAEHF